MTGNAQRFDVVIVGSGPGGAQTAVALRQHGFGGSVLILTQDHELPYERPPLSKAYLAGEKAFDRILIKPPTFWPDKNIQVEVNSRVVEVSPSTRELELSDGGRISFGSLVWAAGGRVRRLSCPGADADGIHFIRNRADVDCLRSELGGSPKKVVVIGGGYIGLESAAVLTKLGCAVTLLEAEERVLARVAGPELSRFYEAEHRKRGVDLRLGTRLASVKQSNGRVCGVSLSDGTDLRCDVVIVGIGIIPEVEPLCQAGAAGENGVEVDQFCRTNLAAIFAVGDCALHRSEFAAGEWVRIESVQNAVDMATTVAKFIVGKPEPYSALPWFWSDQYDLKLQTIGLSRGFTEQVVRGSIQERSFSLVYLKQGRVIALDCVNSVKDFIQGRRLIENSVPVSSSQLLAAENLKELSTSVATAS